MFSSIEPSSFAFTISSRVNFQKFIVLKFDIIFPNRSAHFKYVGRDLPEPKCTMQMVFGHRTNKFTEKCFALKWSARCSEAIETFTFSTRNWNEYVWPISWRLRTRTRCRWNRVDECDVCGDMRNKKKQTRSKTTQPRRAHSLASNTKILKEKLLERWLYCNSYERSMNMRNNRVFVFGAFSFFCCWVFDADLYALWQSGHFKRTGKKTQLRRALSGSREMNNMNNNGKEEQSANKYREKTAQDTIETWKYSVLLLLSNYVTLAAIRWDASHKSSGGKCFCVEFGLNRRFRDLLAHVQPTFLQLVLLINVVMENILPNKLWPFFLHCELCSQSKRVIYLEAATIKAKSLFALITSESICNSTTNKLSSAQN